MLAAIVLALAPRLAVASQWGSGYGDPPGFCPAQSWLPATYLSLPPTNDPTVAANPEQDTFYGYHPYPGYDDWYGYWYGDFRGRPGDASGWRLIRRVGYPAHWHWNFADWGWAVHGHVKQYIAYYNWTFGGNVGLAGRARRGRRRTWPTSTVTRFSTSMSTPCRPRIRSLGSPPSRPARSASPGTPWRTVATALAPTTSPSGWVTTRPG